MISPSLLLRVSGSVRSQSDHWLAPPSSTSVPLRTLQRQPDSGSEPIGRLQIEVEAGKLRERPGGRSVSEGTLDLLDLDDIGQWWRSSARNLGSLRYLTPSRLLSIALADPQGSSCLRRFQDRMVAKALAGDGQPLLPPS